jgi:di/tricarboxylate transporter
MSPLIFTLLILLITLGLFVSGWLRLELVALMMLLALLLTGVISLEEGLAGFSDPVVIMIVSLFVVGGALLNTGTANLLGQGVLRLTGKNETRMVFVLVLAVALLSGIMSSTGTAAVFLPIALVLARQARISPGRLLMPMAFAALLGGMLTLIGTPPNLIVANILKNADLKTFQFFDFTLPGLAALAVSLVYFVTLARWLLPASEPNLNTESEAEITVSQLLKQYSLTQNIRWLRLPPGTFLFGKTLKALNLPQQYGVHVLCMRDTQVLHDNKNHFCTAQTQLHPNHDILVLGQNKGLETFAQETGAVFVNKKASEQTFDKRHLGFAEILLLPRSQLLGKTLSEFNFRERYGLHVVAIQRNNELLSENLGELPLRFGDCLLIQGTWKKITRLQYEKRDFSVLNLPAEAVSQKHRPLKIALTLFWLALMLGLMLLGWLPVVTATLLTAVGLILSRCLSMEEAYHAISWESVILIAAMLPMATALKNTGATEALGTWLGQSLGSFGPYSVMAVLFLLTSGCSLFLSNTVTTVLVAPIALQLAQNLNYSPQTLLMVVALAASSAFASPIASPVNTMVMTPGGYHFKDYLKVGLPLQLLMLGLCLLLIPRLFGL